MLNFPRIYVYFITIITGTSVTLETDDLEDGLPNPIVIARADWDDGVAARASMADRVFVEYWHGDPLYPYVVLWEKPVIAPEVSIDFGSDLACWGDIDALATELPANSPWLVAQANFRRLTTSKSTLVDDPDYGFSIEDLLQQGLTPAFLAAIPDMIRVELMKDDRNEDVVVKVIRDRFNSETLNISISGHTAAGPFNLTGTLTKGGLTLEEILA